MTARAGLIAALLLLGACGEDIDPPAPPTAGEARALADAEAMLDERTPPAPAADAN